MGENREPPINRPSSSLTVEQRQYSGAEILSSTGHTCKSGNLDTDITLIARIYSKCVIDLNVNCKVRKLLEDNIESLDDLGCDDAF